MNMKGNNAEKFATTLIIFFVLFLTYVLVCIIFKTMTVTNLESMVKDGMSFAVTGITPVVAILLFSDWREQHVSIKNEQISDEILNIMNQIRVYLNLSSKFDDKSIFYSKQSEFFTLLLDLRVNLQQINTHDSISKEYKSNIQKAIKSLTDFWESYAQTVNYDFLAENERKYNDSPNNGSLKFYMDKSNSFYDVKHKHRENIRAIIDNLKILHVN